MADFAVQGLGAVTVPIYFNDSPDRLGYVLNDSSARIVITSGDSEARRIAQFRERLPHVERLIAFAPPRALQTDFLDFARWSERRATPRLLNIGIMPLASARSSSPRSSTLPAPQVNPGA